jgi:sugar phosphate permease
MPLRDSNNQTTHHFWACLTWCLTALFFGFQFFLRSSPNAMGDCLGAYFNIGVKHLGWFSSVYYISYSLLQIPTGIALDMWGPKRVLRIGTTICVAGSVVFALAPTFSVALLGRMLIGFGAAAAFIGTIRVTTLWFTPAYLAFSIGLLSAVGKLGGALANKTLPQLMVSDLSWQSLIWMLSGLGGFLSLLIWLFVRNGPQDKFHGAGGQTWSLTQKEVFAVLKNPTVWAMGLYGYAMYLVLSVFSDTYSINFLSSRLAITKQAAGSLSAWAPIGSAVGALVISFLSDRLKKRRFFLRICSCATLIISSIIFFGPPLSVDLVRILLLLLGISSSGQILIFAIVAESFSTRLTGVVTGITNALMMAGGALHNPLVGWLIHRSYENRPSTIGAEVIYTLTDYRVAFSSISLCFFAATIISFFAKETHPSRKKPVNQAIS